MAVAIYVRVSSDETGKHKSVTEQEAAIKAAITDLGYPWNITSVFIDNDISASDKTSKERPDWERLRELVRKGQCDIVAVWEVSRFSRITRVGLDFMEECQEYGAPASSWPRASASCTGWTTRRTAPSCATNSARLRPSLTRSRYG